MRKKPAPRVKRASIANSTTNDIKLVICTATGQLQSVTVSLEIIDSIMSKGKIPSYFLADRYITEYMMAPAFEKWLKNTYGEVLGQDIANKLIAFLESKKKKAIAPSIGNSKNHALLLD